MANSIIAGNDFRLIIRAKKSTGAYLADMDLADVEDLRIYLTRAGRSKVLQSYTLDEEGHAVIYVSAGVVTNATYGIEMVGVYGGARLRAHNTSVFTISGHGGGNSGVLNDYYADIVFVINVAATDVYVQNAIEAHNEDEASHPHLLQLIEEAGDVDDVQIDGESIVDENKIAKIDSSQFGKVDDVKVNGMSVVSNKEANITIPEKVSDLPNDADYATKSELTTGLAAKQDTITAVAEPTIADDGGNPSASVNFEGGEMAFAFRNLKLRFSDLTAADKAELKGDKGDQGDSAVYDPSSPDAPDFVMANTTGQSTTKAMTQKAVTDAICDINLLGNSRFFTAFQISIDTSISTTTAWYATNLGLEKGKKYRIRVRASASHNNATYIILQIVSQQYEGQKAIFDLPAGNTSAEADYFCDDDTLQYMAIYASGGHTVTYNISIVEYIELADNLPTLHQANYVDYFFSLSNYKAAIGNSTKSICISAVGGERMLVKKRVGNQTQMVFFSSLPTLSNNIDLSSYVIGVKIILAGEEEYVTIPQGATIVWINLSAYVSGSLQVFAPEYYKFVEGDGYGISVKNNSVSVSDEIDSSLFVERNAFYSATNRKFAVNENTKGKYLNVKEGQCYRIVADKDLYCAIAAMRSIANVINSMDDSTATRYWGLFKGQEITIRIAKGETILWFNTKTISGGTVINYDASVYYATNPSRCNTPMLLIPVYGQSLAIGGDTTRLTLGAKYPSLTANTEGLYSSYSDNVETSKEGLLDSFVKSYCQDNNTGYTAFGTSVISFSYGQGSTSIIGLKKGTTLYTNFLSKIQAAYNNAGGNLIVPAFCWVQGEDDRFDTNTNDYKGDLAQLREDLDEDIKAITGQEEDVHCIVYQTNQLSIGGSHFVPTNYESGNNGALMSVPQAQYELIRDNEYFHASTPIYMMAFYLSQNGYRIHITNESQRLLGYYEGLQAQRIVNGGADVGLYVSSVTKIDSTHIKLNLHTPCPPLVIDTEQVYEVDGYGFSVITSNNENILQSVSIAPNHFSEQAIIIETSTNCTNAKVRYGVNGTIAINSSGYNTGSRGNIRDSQGLVYIADINGKKVPMHNWLYFFEEIIK